MLAGRSNIIVTDTVSSVSLQQLLYYNSLSSVVYVIFSVINVQNKQGLVYRSALNEQLVVPVLLFWVVAEVCRLLCGYLGNLQEKVPETSAFLVISLFPQLPALIYLTLLQEHAYPFDRIFGWLLLVQLGLEFVIGTNSLRKMIRHQTAQFYRLCQEEY
jgi:transmembrane protein 17